MSFQRIYVGLAVKLLFLKKFIFIPLFFLCSTAVWGQPAFSNQLINTDTIQDFVSIENSTFYRLEKRDKNTINQVTNTGFMPLVDFKERKKVAVKDIASVFYLKFTLKNDSSVSRSFSFFPGKLVKHFNLYQSNNGNAFTEVKIGKIYSGFVPITVAANEQTTFILRFKFFKYSYNKINPCIITPDHLRLFKAEMYETLSDKKIASIILSGMLLMMMLVTLVNYYISKRIEFLFNALYSFCMFLLIYFTGTLTMNPGWFNGFFLSYLDLLLLMAGIISFLAFTRHFLNSKNYHPKLNRFLITVEWTIAFLVIAFSILHFGFNEYQTEIYFENAMKIFLLSAGMIYISLSIGKKNKLMNYLAIGAGSQIFFSIISFALILSTIESESIFTSAIFYFELGVICSFMFFLLGLIYKNRLELITKIKEQEALKLEVEKQSFENQLSIFVAQQEERNRISADMHDDLGAGMTSIRLYSELAKSKVSGNIIPEIEKISSSADELINKMNAIIWSMSSQNDSLSNMIAYIRSYTIEYFENTGIKPTIELPENIPHQVVMGTIRRNVFLVVKEALQNIVKHAGATEVKIIMGIDHKNISLSIQDNGKGIDLENLRQFSNGLKNMKKRMEDVNICFSIENNNGTLIKLTGKRYDINASSELL